MKIGIEAQRLFRPHKHGIEVFALELIKALQSIDNKNQYYIFVKKDTDNACLQSSANFEIVEVPGKSFADWEQISLPKYCKKLGIELLHLTGNTAPLIKNTKTIQTVHDIIYLDKVEFGGTMYQNFGNLYRRFIVPITAKKADIVTTVSDFEKNRIAKAFNTKQEVITVYNGVNNKFHPNYTDSQKQELKEKYNIKKDFVLFLGNTAPRKNATKALNAFAKSASNNAHNYDLLCPALSSQQVKDMLSEDNQSLLGNFISSGFIDKDDLGCLYASATALLFPSISEGFGLPIVEAMASGCPVITSNTTSMPEIAGEAALLVDPNEEESISKAITDLLSNSQLRSENVARGFERIKHFSWTITAEKYLNIYRMLGSI